MKRLNEHCIKVEYEGHDLTQVRQPTRVIEYPIEFPYNGWLTKMSTLKRPSKGVSENQFQRREERFERLVEATGALVIGLDRKGCITLFNRRCEEVTGYSRHDILGKNVFTILIPTKERGVVKTRFNKILAGKLPSTPLETHWITKNGEYRLMRWNNTFITDDKGTVHEIFGIGIDITDSKKAETALQESEARYRRLYENLADGLLLTDKHGTITLCNEKAAQIFRYSTEEMIGTHIRKFFHPDDRRRALRVFKSGLKNRRVAPAGFEWKGQRKDGELFFFHVTSTLLITEGKIQGYQFLIREITESKRAEQALRESEEKFRTLAEESLQGILIIQDMHIMYANQAFANFSGYSVEELYSLSHNEVTAAVHPEDQVKVWGRMQKRLKGKSVPQHYEFRGIRKDGTLRWGELYSTRIEYQGRPAVQVAVVDITERKQAEAAVKESEAKYRTLVEQSLEGIVIYQDDQIVFANPAIESLSGYPLEEIMALPPTEIWSAIHPDDRIIIASRLQDRLAGKPVPSRYETRIFKKDGSMYWAEISVNLIIFNGRPAVQATYMDITERKRAEINILAAQQRAEFLVDLMAHDLNNINQGIMLSLELLAQNLDLPRSLEKGVQDALSQVERSAELIANVKRFQSLDAEPQMLGIRDLAPPFNAAVEAVQRAFPHKTLTMKTNIKDSMYSVLADGFLSEMFFNVIHNAMKYDRKEHVLINVNADLSSNEKYVKVQIKDHGPGIPDSEKAHVFSRYTDSWESTHGSGIGLTLVQRIVQRYGGQILVKDRISGDHTKGANFVILLPRGDRES